MSYKWPGIPNGDYSFDHGRAVWNKIINYLRRLSEKLDSDIVDATADRRGMMTAADKDKLDGVEPGAEVNQNAFSGVKVGSSTIEADSKTDTIELVAGSNVTLTANAANDTITIDSANTTYSDMTGATGQAAGTHGLVPQPAAGDNYKCLLGNGGWDYPTFINTTTGTQNVDRPVWFSYQYENKRPVYNTSFQYNPSTNNLTVGTINGFSLGASVPANAVFTDTTYSAATTNADGLMSATDKSKLDGIAAGAEVNQNAFSNIQVGPAIVAADSKTDTLTLGPGAGVIISANTTNDSITIGCVEATQSVPGIMSTADKTKLDGITAGAEPNQNAFSNVKVGSTTVAADGKTDTLELVAGSNVTLTPDATNDKVTISATDTVYTHPATSGNKHIPSGGSSGQILRWSADGTAAWGDDNNTDVNVTATKVATFPSSTTNYYLLASSSDATATEGVSKFGTNARLQIKAGTTSTDGFATIILGNSTASGTAGNVTGTLLLYNNSTKYAQLKAHNNDTINHTIYLPKAGGTLVCHTTDTAIGSATMPVYISADGVATACTYELKKTVPADAVFTDHIYTAASDTPQPVTAVGAVGTSDKYAREDHIHARRCAHVGQSGSSTTNPWFKFATFTINANWIGNETTFIVTGPYLDRYGILVVRFTSNGSAVFSSATVKWLVTHRIYPENFMLVVGNDNKTLELWAKCGSSYERYTFTVLSETSRGGPQTLWTLLTSVSAGEAASPTAGTQFVSTLEGASGKLGTSNVGSANQPIYLNAGVATACTVEGIVAQSIDTGVGGGHSSYIKFNSGLVFIWGAENFTTDTGTYVDVLKKIPCTTISAFATDSEAATSSTAASSNLHQISWARGDTTNTTERFVTNTTNTGYFNYIIIGKA